MQLELELDRWQQQYHPLSLDSLYRALRPEQSAVGGRGRGPQGGGLRGTSSASRRSARRSERGRPRMVGVGEDCECEWERLEEGKAWRWL